MSIKIFLFHITINRTSKFITNMSMIRINTIRIVFTVESVNKPG